MPTIQKFYLHDAVSSDTGTFPTVWQGSSGGATDASFATIHATSEAVGVLQTSFTTTAIPAGAVRDIRQFASASLAAQTIGVGTWTYLGAIRRASGAGQIVAGAVVFIWRPSTGVLVGKLCDSGAVPNGSISGSLTEAGSGGTLTGSAVTCQDNDVLMVQIQLSEQSGISSATGQWYYDGTVDPVDGTATTDAASYVLAPAAITLRTNNFTASASDTLGLMGENLPPQILQAKKAFQVT